MRAEGADREQLVTAPREQYRFAVRVPKQHGSVGEFRERDALDEIGSAEFARCFVHSMFRFFGYRVVESSPARCLMCENPCSWIMRLAEIGRRPLISST